MVVHAFTDGRDTSTRRAARSTWPRSRAGGARVGTVVGRYFAMDRDKRWDRIKKACDLLVLGRAHHADTAEQAARDAYERDETDEFITPTTGRRGGLHPARRLRVAFNFRPDRMREITLALTDPDFDEIDRGGAEVIERYTTLAEYDEDWTYPVVFPPKRPSLTIGQVDLRARGSASCTSPRPRSIRT